MYIYIYLYIYIYIYINTQQDPQPRQFALCTVQCLTTETTPLVAWVGRGCTRFQMTCLLYLKEY